MAENLVARFQGVLNSENFNAQLKNALGERRDQYVASLIEVYASDKQLQTCAPGLVAMECLKAAVLNLPVNKALGYAYIVVYNNKKKDEQGNWSTVATPTFIIGYKGLIQLAQRSGLYRSIYARDVREGELVGEDMLTGDITLRHIDNRETKPVVGYFAHFELLNGFKATLYVTVHDMAVHARTYSKGLGREVTVAALEAAAQAVPGASKTTGWMGNFGAMAQKTVLRNLISKYGPMSIEMQKMMEQELQSEEATEPNDAVTEDIKFESVNESSSASAGEDDVTVIKPDF